MTTNRVPPSPAPDNKQVSLLAHFMRGASEAEVEAARSCIRQRARDDAIRCRTAGLALNSRANDFDVSALWREVRFLRDAQTELRAELRRVAQATVAAEVRRVLAEELPEAVTYLIAAGGRNGEQATR